MESCVQIEDLDKSFGADVIFSHLSMAVSQDEKVGIIARNGTGKTTLLNIIAGKEDYSSGRISFRRGLRISYLVQNPQADPSMSVMDLCVSSSPEIAAARAAYAEALDSHDQDRLHQAMERMDASGAWDFEARACEMLSRTGISDTAAPIGTLSGGQAKRAALAAELLREPDLLILDEPTNHLDIASTLFLEDYLSERRLTLIMVTHDRYLLDRVCDRIIELDDHRAYSYPGNYSVYLEKRQERMDAAQSQRQSDLNRYRTELEWIRRQPQARGSKSRARTDAFEQLQEKLRSQGAERELTLNFKSSRIGKKIFSVRGLTKYYGDYTILKDFDYDFARFEKLGIVGENGAGKTTFLRMLLGAEAPDGGTVDVGDTVRFGYYSQAGMEICPTERVIDVIASKAEHIRLADGRTCSASQFLQYFLFSPPDQQKLVSKLSGGEKKRLYLCSILMQSPNFLILDEPTNDLDIMTLQVLEEYLASYDGCLIVVSHDRFFMDRVADHLMVFEGNGRIRMFPGGYSAYLAQAPAMREEASSPRQQTASRDSLPRQRDKTQRLSYKEKQEMASLESELEDLAAEKAALEAELCAPNLPRERIRDISVRLSQIVEMTPAKEDRWLELSERDC